MKRELVPIVTIQEAMECATIMSSTDAWVIQKRTYEDCLKLFLDRSRDIFIMKENIDGNSMGDYKIHLYEDISICYN